MKSGFFLAIALVALGTLAVPVTAQWDVNGPNASLTLNGQTASVVDPTNHLINIGVPGMLNFAVTSGANANQPVLLLIGPPAAGNFVIPWGTIDLGVGGAPTGVAIALDGLGQSTGNPFDAFAVTDAGDPIAGTPPTFGFGLSIPGGLGGSTPSGWQSIVSDPTAPPFMLDNTETAAPNFVNGQTLTVNTGDDGSIAITLVNGTFNFYGVNYTEVWVGGNGLITFGGPLGFPGAYYAPGSTNQWTDIPHIAVNYSDWNPIAASPSDGVLVNETGATIDIGWGASLGSAGTTAGGISHFGDTDLSEFHCILELDTGTNPAEGTISLVYTTLDPASLNGNDTVLGITGGGSTGPQPVSEDLASVVVGVQDQTMFEEHDANGNLTYAGPAGAGNAFGYDGFGARHAYHNGNKYRGQTLTFMPNTSLATTGDQGYISLASLPRIDDATAITPSSGSINGGDTVVIAGWFQNFGPLGTVIFDPTGAAVPAAVLGIYDNSATHMLALPNPSNPEYRDMEGLVVITPPMPVATTVDVQVTFASGATFTLSSAFLVSPANSATTIYNAIGDDASQMHALTQPGANSIVYGGVPYGTIYLGSNSMVTFGVGSADFSPSMAEFFAGWQATPTTAANPGVALYWADYARGSVTTDDITVIEDGTLGTVEVQYNNQVYWDGQGLAGSWSCTFGLLGPGSVTIDLTNVLLNNVSGTDQNPVVGVSDGNDDGLGNGVSATGDNNTGDLDVLLGGFYSTGSAATVAPESIGEQFTAGTLDITVLNFLELGDGVGTPFFTWQIL